MKTSKTLVALAVAGLIGGLAVDQAYAGDTAGHDTKAEADKNSCKGKSGCNGKGSCSSKDGDKGEDHKADKNSCSGKNGCSSKDAKK